MSSTAAGRPRHEARTRRCPGQPPLGTAGGQPGTGAASAPAGFFQEEQVMEFRLLGPVEARVDGQNIDLGRAKQRLILAILVANAGRAISTQDLIDMVWDDDP